MTDAGVRQNAAELSFKVYSSLCSAIFWPIPTDRLLCLFYIYLRYLTTSGQLHYF